MKSFHIILTLTFLSLLETKAQSEFELRSVISDRFAQIFGKIENKLQLKAIENNVSELSFANYMKIFNKSYTEDEKLNRFEIFQKNVKTIIESKLNYLEATSSYVLDVNKHSDKVSSS